MIRAAHLLTFVWVAAACGEAAPVRSPLETLAVGVNIHDESEEIVRGLVSAGYVVDERIDAVRFTAIGLHRGDSATAVRVVTARGVAYSIDGDDDITRRSPRVSLVRPPANDERMRSATEIVIGVHDQDLDRTCLQILTLTVEDTIVAVPVRAGASTPGACIESLRDVDDDGALEAMVVYRAIDLARADAPTVELPLTRDPGFGGLSESHYAFPTYFRREAERRERELSAARAHLDVERAYVIGIEMAIVALTRGAAPTAAEQLFDDALRGLVLSESQAHSVAAVRALLHRGMTQSPTNANDDDHVEGRS
ncbi:MAG: hypothetical protein IPK60_22310 [Sandaracinaceae bacterium]|nr:hypothetical protein [Sandaracinaceae bacterium]